MSKSKTILVTGGAGFIGSAVTRRLLEAGHTVVAIDNFNEYYDQALKRDRAKHFLTDATVIKGDITDQSLITTLFAEHQFDLVCHLGTLCVILHFFLPDIKERIEKGWAGVLPIIAGTLPLFFLLPILKPLEELMSDPSYLGYFYLASAFIILTGKPEPEPQDIPD